MRPCSRRVPTALFPVHLSRLFGLPAKLRDNLKENESAARQRKELATIVSKIPVKLNLDECQFTKYDRDEVVGELFEERGDGFVAGRAGRNMGPLGCL